MAQRLRHAALLKLQRLAHGERALEASLPLRLKSCLQQHQQRLERAALRLDLLDPRLVLRRGYALLTDDQGRAVTSVVQAPLGAQLHAALAQMGADGAGVLLYLNQEGRGIGLANKMRAYSLQDQGFDTVEANHRLGFEDDERDFRIGADILKRMGFSAVRLLTNNPKKLAMMETCGVRVAERVPLHVGETAQNRAYLATKAAKSGHLP